MSSSHTCNAVIVSCIDFRFQNYIHEWIEKNLQGKTYDYIAFAGSTKNLETILGQIDISVRLHAIEEVVLMHHEECGAYGVESTPERHATDLRRAREAILAKYPHLRVSLFYIHLDGTFENVA